MERIVHLTNGDRTADNLSLADLPGEIRVWADALDQGPVITGTDAELHASRSAYLTSRGLGADAVARLGEFDQALDDAAGAEELVLWFEHDLFDQLALIRVLAWLLRRGLPPQLSIVTLDRHPAVPQFLGLGQLEPAQLAELWPRRTALSRDALDEAVTAWIAFTANDPRALPFLMRRIKAMPFLAGAIERHLEEFPDALSGLSRTERQLLAAIARGVSGAADLLQAVQAIDPRYPITDTELLRTIQNLAHAGLVAGTDAAATITTAGRHALAGAIDRVATVGIDTWRGGVHLTGTGPVWRWDSAAKKLVER